MKSGVNKKNQTYNARNRIYQDSRMRGGFATMEPGYNNVVGGAAGKDIDEAASVDDIEEVLIRRQPRALE